MGSPQKYGRASERKEKAMYLWEMKRLDFWKVGWLWEETGPMRV